MRGLHEEDEGERQNVVTAAVLIRQLASEGGAAGVSQKEDADDRAFLERVEVKVASRICLDESEGCGPCAPVLRVPVEMEDRRPRGCRMNVYMRSI